MLVTKFLVPIRRNIHTNVVKFSSRGRECGKTTTCEKVKNVQKKSAIDGKHGECQEKYTECPKTLNEYACPQALPSQPGSKSKIRNSVDVYQESYQNLTKQANFIVVNIQGETNAMLEQLRKGIEASKKSEQAQVQGYLQDIKKKIQRLLLLDPSFGSMKRNSAMSLNDQIQQAFHDVECNVMPQIKRINEISNNLQRDVQTCIERAKSLITACRKCKNAFALNKCIEENASYAEKILQKTSENTKLSLKKLDALQREILEHHKASIGKVSRAYSKRGKEFSEHLDDCIYALRNRKK